MNIYLRYFFSQKLTFISKRTLFLSELLCYNPHQDNIKRVNLKQNKIIKSYLISLFIGETCKWMKQIEKNCSKTWRENFQIFSSPSSPSIVECFTLIFYQNCFSLLKLSNISMSSYFFFLLGFIKKLSRLFIFSKRIFFLFVDDWIFL